MPNLLPSSNSSTVPQRSHWGADQADRLVAALRSRPDMPIEVVGWTSPFANGGMTREDLGHALMLCKFRTIRHDELAAGPAWAAPNDPCVTLLGRFLRRARPDESLQLCKVLEADMDFVGPGPEFAQRLIEDILYHQLQHPSGPALRAGHKCGISKALPLKPKKNCSTTCATSGTCP